MAIVYFVLGVLIALLVFSPKQKRRELPIIDVPSDMSERQAADILGLAAGFSAADVKAAHKALIKRLHPDQGGSAYLARLVNEAKRVLSSDSTDTRDAGGSD